MNQKKKCFHKWEDLAIINYLSETSVICNKCGEEVLKAGHPKQQNDRFERIVSRLNTLLTEKYNITNEQWNEDIAPILRIFLTDTDD